MYMQATKRVIIKYYKWSKAIDLKPKSQVAAEYQNNEIIIVLITPPKKR